AHAGDVPTAEALRSRNLQVRFFFQAEDGIRDATVTGVQTCALPISPVIPRSPSRWRSAPPVSSSGLSPTRMCFRSWSGMRASTQIGRASCRERVEMPEVVGSVRKEGGMEEEVQDVSAHAATQRTPAE